MQNVSIIPGERRSQRPPGQVMVGRSGSGARLHWSPADADPRGGAGPEMNTRGYSSRRAGPGRTALLVSSPEPHRT